MYNTLSAMHTDSLGMPSSMLYPGALGSMAAMPDQSNDYVDTHLAQLMAQTGISMQQQHQGQQQWQLPPPPPQQQQRRSQPSAKQHPALADLGQQPNHHTKPGGSAMPNDKPTPSWLLAYMSNMQGAGAGGLDTGT